MTFDEAFDVLIGHEGGYSNNPVDPGGETMWGVTARVARANGYAGEMRNLPKETAKAIYKKLYWDAVKADELSPVIRYAMFDAAVNSGAKQAVRWLQRAVEVEDDGILGPLTLAEGKHADYAVKCKMLGFRLDFMTSLPTYYMFGKGWSRRIAALLQM